jgi:hypothetical protein
MKQLSQLFNQAPKRRSFSSLGELGMNNFQSLEILISKEILKEFKPNEVDKPNLASLLNNLNGNQRIPTEENAKRALNFSFNFNPMNNYPTPSASPLFEGRPRGAGRACEEDKKKLKKRKI